MKNENIPYKIYLNESEMPKAWYNLRADMKQRPEPVNGVLPFPWKQKLEKRFLQSIRELPEASAVQSPKLWKKL